MNPTESELAEQRMRNIMGNVLRAGVITAAFIVFIGGVLYLIRYGHNLPDYDIFKGQPEELRHPSTIISNALAFRRRALIELGLLILVATPTIQILFAAFNFIRQRDYIYSSICLIVLILLCYSLTL
jgi:uncharacterized membrane protein